MNTQAEENAKKNKRIVTMLLLLIMILVALILVLTFYHLKGTDSHKELIGNVITNVIAYLAVSITTVIFVKVVFKENIQNFRGHDPAYLTEIKTKIDDLERASSAYIKKSSKKIDIIDSKIDKIDTAVSFQYSGKDVYSHIFQHYLESKDNCLDYIAIASTEEIIDYAINKELKGRMKGNNDREISVNEKLREYQKFIIDSNDEIKNITSALSNISQGALHKIICDVKIGGVIYEIFNDSSDGEIYYLFAATVDQQSIDQGTAYSELETIFDEIRDKVENEFDISVVNNKN